MKQRRRKKREKRPAGSTLLRCVKAALAGCVLSVILLLLFALVLKWELAGEGSIPIVTAVIKALSAAAAGLIAANGMERRNWLFGGMGGGIYILLAFIAFSLVEKAFSPSLAILADIGLGLAAGAVGGAMVQTKGS